MVAATRHTSCLWFTAANQTPPFAHVTDPGSRRRLRLRSRTLLSWRGAPSGAGCSVTRRNDAAGRWRMKPRAPLLCLLSALLCWCPGGWVSCSEPDQGFQDSGPAETPEQGSHIQMKELLQAEDTWSSDPGLLTEERQKTTEPEPISADKAAGGKTEVALEEEVDLKPAQDQGQSHSQNLDLPPSEPHSSSRGAQNPDSDGTQLGSSSEQTRPPSPFASDPVDCEGGEALPPSGSVSNLPAPLENRSSLREQEGTQAETQETLGSPLMRRDKGSNVSRPLKDKGGGATENDTPVAKEAEDIPTFDEWRKKMMEVEKEKSQSVPMSFNGATHTLKKVQKNFNNYASVECGAKILSANSDAKSTSSILMENMDVYMLNPCSNKIWFVIELCEPIQVKQLDIANFELFSSTPKDFVVSISDRYPTNKWVKLGTFHAQDERIVQSFPLDEHLYAKYIKVELLSHFGSEHFCPLSLVRVFGTSMVEEYEEISDPSERSEISEDDDDYPPGFSPTGRSQKNIIGSAKDAILNMVNNIAANVLGTGVEDGGNMTNPGVNGTNTTSSTLSSASTLPVENAQGAPDVEGSSTSPPETQPTPIVTLLPEEEEPRPDPSSLCCQQASGSSCCLAPALQELLLHYCAISQPAWQKGRRPQQPAQPVPTVSLSLERPRPSPTTTTDPSFYTDWRPTPPTDIPAASGPAVAPPADPGDLAPSLTSALTEASTPKETPTLNLQVPAALSEPKSERSSTLSESSTTSVSSTSCSTVLSSALPTEEQPCLPSEDPNLRTSMEESAVLPLTQAPAVSPGGTDAPPPSGTLQLNASLGSVDLLEESILEGQLLLSSSSSSSPEFSAELPGSNESGGGSLNSVHNSAQKESVFMRLNNRIKALEMNMSLSGRYLEQLSQRYRKQMEEMQKAFNKTIIKLQNTARVAEEQDQRQTESITVLQAQLENVTALVLSLSLRVTQLQIEVSDRQCYFLLCVSLSMLLGATLIYGYCRVSSSAHTHSKADLHKPYNYCSLDRSECEEVGVKRRASYPQLTPSTAGLGAVCEVDTASKPLNKKKRCKMKKAETLHASSLAAAPPLQPQSTTATEDVPKPAPPTTDQPSEGSSEGSSHSDDPSFCGIATCSRLCEGVAAPRGGVESRGFRRRRSRAPPACVVVEMLRSPQRSASTPGHIPTLQHLTGRGRDVGTGTLGVMAASGQS
uniref:SUN domain-containing protein n=2 Tax=Denticeps clupeoides TaxID=299321 RepID=A0AAY4AWR5_9TELE